MTPADALEKTRKIQEFRAIVKLVQDENKRKGLFQRALASIARIRLFWVVVSLTRYVFKPISSNDWIIVFDGGRVCRRDTETNFEFLERIGRTNRSVRLPELVGITKKSNILAVDMAQATKCKNGTYATLPFLFAITGIRGLSHLFIDFIVGLCRTKSVQSALLYSTLRLISKRSHIASTGLLLTTSVSWLAEALRVGLSSARDDLRIFEVLHGAGTKNTAAYFQWVHEQSLASIDYINLIADLPRYEPLKGNMVTDQYGEISCNLRLWQGSKNNLVKQHKEISKQHSILFIGGASTDLDYSESSFFQKELEMVEALTSRSIGPIFYAPHPVHNSIVLSKMLENLALHNVIATDSTTLELILGASLVVGGLSTSLIEAALLGVPSFAYENFEELFIVEIAGLMTWDLDPDLLATKIESTYSHVSKKSKAKQISDIATNAAQRCGIELVRS